ncbi:hypothetical protein [Pseudoclavibacter sp. AY1H1]|uniref:Acb2/Tad1 domain-containing protein n=1 Tax=Pseudoclavibacter sp. AY1H1 TaxID=2080584 RepID=UPI000CE88F22|nr:hypothetical protein [Pseudoclavibacter sp. AY1H1]PPF39989.1 hypothetical protein C5E05_01890 [Pseudoclavibacter sp. AY1H1]
MSHASPSIEERFPTSVSAGPPTDEQVVASGTLRKVIVAAATAVDRLVPAGRDKSIALTALEDALMRGNRGIFNPPKE